MKKHMILAAIAATALCTSCSNEEDFSSQEATPVSFTINKEVITRTTTTATGSNGQYVTKFVVGDEIGIFETSANVKNVKLTVEAQDKLTPAQNISIYDSQEYTFYAYSPYKAASESQVSFNVEEDQSDETNFNNSNFLIGIGEHAAKSDAKVSLNFSPALAMVFVNVSGPTGQNTSAVTIKNVNKSITWDTQSQSVTTSTEAEDKTNIIMRKMSNEEQKYIAFVPAQTITQGTTFLTFSINGKLYAYTPSSTNITLQSGKRNIFNVEIGESTINLTAQIGQDITFTDGTTENVSWDKVGEYNYITMPTTITQVTANANSDKTYPWSYQGLTSAAVNSENNSITCSMGTVPSTGANWSNHTLYFYSTETLDLAKYKLTIEGYTTSNTTKSVYVFLYSFATSNFIFYACNPTGSESGNKVYTQGNYYATGSTTLTWTIDTSKYYNSNSVGSNTTTDKTNNSSVTGGFKVGITFNEGDFTFTDISLTKIEDITPSSSSEGGSEG